MCTVCGCGDGEKRIEGVNPAATDLHMGRGEAGVSVAGMEQSKLVKIEQDILSKNNRIATVNRRLFQASQMLVLNLMSSPGSGKTTLLVRTLQDLTARWPLAVIEGDQETTLDADRIRATGVPALQVNTGKGCHLDAEMVTLAVGELNPPSGTVLFVENVGNLVCPAAFDLGETRRVAMLSVTEGEDKPLKYPGLFASADLLLVTKSDLLPYVGIDLDKLIAAARAVRPGLTVITVSATTGEGLEAWYAWLAHERDHVQGAPHDHSHHHHHHDGGEHPHHHHHGEDHHHHPAEAGHDRAPPHA